MKCLFIFLIFFIQGTAWAGWENGNAGDTYAAEFILTARDLHIRLKLLPASELGPLDLEKFAGTILGTTVRTQDKVIYVDGHQVEAINYPEQKLILLSRNYWRENRVTGRTFARFVFVLHEYLGIMKIDDSQYRISERLVSMLDIKDYSLLQFWHSLNPMNHVSLRLVYSPQNCSLKNMSFDLTQTKEALVSEAQGDCGDAYRRIEIMKGSFTAPPAMHVKGSFQKYEIKVLNRRNEVTGLFEYEPEWGKCIFPQDGSCQLSGKVQSGGVEFSFWLLR